MRVLRYQIAKKNIGVPFELTREQKILLMPVGDIHFGSEKWPEEKMVNHLRWGMDRGATFLGMGDYFDFASFSQRLILKQLRDSSRKEIEGMIELKIQSLLDLIYFTKGHWIGLVEGHHFWEFADGTTSDQRLCKALECEFLGTSGLIRLSYDNVSSHHPEADCIVYLHHGLGAPRTSGGHLNRVEDLLKWIDADIYLMGHSHSKVSSPIDRQYVSPDGIHYHRTKVMARTGGWLTGYVSNGTLGLDEPAWESRGTYVEQKLLMPSAMGGLAFGIGYELISGSKYYRPTIHYSV